MRITERELPGIGTRRDLTTGDGERVAVVEHLGAARELFLFAGGDETPRGSVRLRDGEARLLGAILAGTFLRAPVGRCVRCDPPGPGEGAGDG